MKKVLSILLLTTLLVPAAVLAQCSYTLSAAVTDNNCFNGTNGTITATITGGTAPYQYQLAEAGAGAWQSGNIFTALAANTYPLSAKDASGCITTIYKTVTQPTQLSVPYTGVDPTCSGSSNGSITVMPAGGVTPYSYNWTKDGSAFATTKDLTGLSSGNYLLTVTDANGCTASPIINSVVRTIGLTGFNEDVIADGLSTAASSATTRAIDQSPGNVFFSSAYTNGSGTAGTNGLPSSGNFPSAQNAARTYQLAPYSSNNTLLLRSTTDNANGGATSGTLGFLSQYKSPYATLYVVGTTGSGTGTINYTVNFSDATTFTGSLNFPDWSLAAATASSIRALGSLDRVSRTSPGTYGGSTNFNLFEAPISIPAGSQGKLINSIDMAWSAAGSARTSIFAITGYTSTTSGIRVNDGATSSATPSISITADANLNQFCSGQTVVFTASPFNGGSAPSYQWKLNGSNVGSNSPTYSNNTLNNNDQVSVVMTASGGVSCLATTTATSTALTMALTPKAASVSASTFTNNVCAGQTVSFTANPLNGGASPSYQWKLNGSNVGINSDTYTTNTLNNADQVSVSMTSSIGCATGSPASSTPLSMTVGVNAAPTATITSVPAITFSSSISYGGTTPAYQWYKNGTAIAGATSASYYTGTAVVGDQYALKLTSNYTCKTAPAAMSNYIQVTLGTLPVKIASFTAEAAADKILLKWKTTYELQSKGFAIQRATGSSGNFQTVGYINSLSQVSGSLYSFTDNPAVSGTYYYRLEQEDVDGHQSYSNTLSVVMQHNRSFQVADLSSKWSIQSNGSLHYYLFDAEGKLAVQGASNGTVSIAKPAAAGVYILKIIMNGITSTQKLIK